MTGSLLSKRLSHNICPTQTIINNFRWHCYVIKNSLILSLVWNNSTCYAMALGVRLQISGCIKLSAVLLVHSLLSRPHLSLFKIISVLLQSPAKTFSHLIQITYQVIADLRKNKDFPCTDVFLIAMEKECSRNRPRIYTIILF